MCKRENEGGRRRGKRGCVAHSFVHWIYLIGACKNSSTEANCACCWIMDHNGKGLPGSGAGLGCSLLNLLGSCLRFRLQVKNLPQLRPPVLLPHTRHPSSLLFPSHFCRSWSSASVSQFFSLSVSRCSKVSGLQVDVRLTLREYKLYRDAVT